MQDRQLENKADSAKNTISDLIDSIDELEDTIFVLEASKEELMEELNESTLENIELGHKLIEQEIQLAELVKLYTLLI